jgi:rhodanese-related sulfurtransferase
VTKRRTLDDLLAAARARIDRCEPANAWAAAEEGACIVDVRSAPAQIVPGSLLIPRTVLEWRLDPDSASRSPYAPGLGERVIVLCDHGESSSLAAATLVELGFSHAGDVVGGFAAWIAAGLPVVDTRQTHEGLPGMAPPVTAGA